MSTHDVCFILLLLQISPFFPLPRTLGLEANVNEADQMGKKYQKQEKKREGESKGGGKERKIWSKKEGKKGKKANNTVRWADKQPPIPRHEPPKGRRRTPCWPQRRQDDLELACRLVFGVRARRWSFLSAQTPSPLDVRKEQAICTPNGCSRPVVSILLWHAAVFALPVGHWPLASHRSCQYSFWCWLLDDGPQHDGIRQVPHASLFSFLTPELLLR